MSRNPTKLERAEALVAQARALPGLRKTHCTLGALASAAGLAGGRFPSPIHGGLILWRLNHMLSPARAEAFARRVAACHDQGRAEESWAALHEALTYGLPREPRLRAVPAKAERAAA